MAKLAERARPYVAAVARGMSAAAPSVVRGIARGTAPVAPFVPSATDAPPAKPPAPRLRTEPPVGRVAPRTSPTSHRVPTSTGAGRTLSAAAPSRTARGVTAPHRPLPGVAGGVTAPRAAGTIRRADATRTRTVGTVSPVERTGLHRMNARSPVRPTGPSSARDVPTGLTGPPRLVGPVASPVIPGAEAVPAQTERTRGPAVREFGEATPAFQQSHAAARYNPFRHER